MAQGCLVIVASHVCIEITPLLWSHAALLSIKMQPAFSSLVLRLCFTPRRLLSRGLDATRTVAD
jgi:hypothetical protein